MQFKTPSAKNKNKNIEKEFKNLRKELLDLSLRNPLLNFKEKNRTVSFINQSPRDVYQSLVLENRNMHFKPVNKENENSKAREFLNNSLGFLSEDKKDLKTDLSKTELNKRLRYIDQQAKTMVQEQGYNILYIAAGFIEWIDRKKPRQKNLAPLILIPVEMERKNVGKSFSLSWTGEDIQNNISLQAKLLENGIELPKFEQTSAIEATEIYLNKVKQAIRSVPNWEVNDKKVSLGFFSFTKFIMYNDLNPESWQDDVDLTNNELIQAIFNPSKNTQEDTFKEEEVDEKLHYKTMYQVLDADSSQIAVIENVKAGHNLVVEGPPGTGKSQTIVNLIAELIAEGKTVLFVSEKMAALEVVKGRLDSVGLGKFVLELHSHKTRRKKLLKNLQKATNVKPTRDLKLDQTLRKLENLRKQLDEYAELIHQPVAKVNLSPFELYGMKESSESYFSNQNRLLPLVRFDNPWDISEKDLDDIILSLENLSELYGTISKNNPWSYCNPKSLLPADLREIEMLIRDTLEALNDFRFEMSVVNEVYGIKVPNTLKDYEDSIMALNLLNSSNVKLIDSSILLNGEWFNNPERAINLIRLLQEYQKSAPLFEKFSDYILIADLDTIINDLERDSHKKFKLFGGNSHREELNNLYKGQVPSENQAINELLEVKKHIKARQSLKDYEDLGGKYFGSLWSKTANINDLNEVNSWMNRFVYLISNGIFSEATIKLISNDLFQMNIDSGIEEYIEKGNKFYNTLRKLESKLNPRSKLIFKKETNEVPFDMWEKQLNKWKGQLSSLHLWSQYSNTKKACLNTQSSIFVKTIEKRNIKKDDVKSLVLGNFADSLLNIVFAENDILATFIGELHENRIDDFKDLDRKIINLNRKRIFNKLNSQIPKIYGATDDEEAKILAGEFTRKSGHIPVRTLLEKAGGTIKKIKPIFMMSPLSIAQYLDPTNPKLQFDVVIFDEASQVKPEDALGAFMRGKTAVVMGDTQQLPPTSFFDQMTDYESDEEVATALDMESILHLCKLSFPVKMLKWHYRSRHESLINISNKEFYDNELLVYPSPSHNDPDLGLKFHYNPDTSYDRGNSSANYKEAHDVVVEIFKHFEKWGDKKSLGVGTFSVAQKNAILEELEIERKAHPEFEPLFSDKRKERFFVKNLETIQGDERDVILISIGYGYDTEGKMSLNFGPLNQDGGERRLNVLVTRAREKCVVFSNFKAHDIHLTANPPFGVKSLRNFLEYAENLQLNQHIEDNDDYMETPFEDAIYNFLVKNDYAVDEKIGCAGFRVDLAIVDEENPGKYLLGIECDGRNYASSKVARDRDRLREQVLTGLGWNIYHLWSTDWYRNRDLAQSRLLEYIESTKINTRVNEIKTRIHEVESAKINPITTVIIDKEEENFKNTSEDLENTAKDLKNNDEDLKNTAKDLKNSDEDLENTSKDLEKSDEYFENTSKEKNNNKNINHNLEDELEKNSDTNIVDESEMETIEDIKTKIGSIKSNDESQKDNQDEIKTNKDNTKLTNETIKEKSLENSKKEFLNDLDSEIIDYLEYTPIDETIDNKNKENIEIENTEDKKNNESNNKKDIKIVKNNKKKEIKTTDNNKKENKTKSNEIIKNNEHILKDSKNINNKNIDNVKNTNITTDKENSNKNLINVDEGFVYEKDINKPKSKSIFQRINETFTNSKENREIEFNSKETKTSDKNKESEKSTKKETKTSDKNKESEKSTKKETKTSDKNKESEKSTKKETKTLDEGKKSKLRDEDLENTFKTKENSNIDKNIDNINNEDSELMKLNTPKRKVKNIIDNDLFSESREDSLNEIDNINNKNNEDFNYEREDLIEDDFLEDTETIIPISAEIREKEKSSEDLNESDYIVPIKRDDKNYRYSKNNEKNTIEDISKDKNFGINDNLTQENKESKSENQNRNTNDNGDDYYYSAVGIENALKKNAISQQKNNNKSGIVGTLSNLKNGMEYYNSAMKEIENPTEREKIYVIDRLNDDGEEIQDYMEIPQDYDDLDSNENKSFINTLKDFSNVEKDISAINNDVYEERYDESNYYPKKESSSTSDFYSKIEISQSGDDYLKHPDDITIEPQHLRERKSDLFTSDYQDYDEYLAIEPEHNESGETFSSYLESDKETIVPVNSSSASENINYQPSMKNFNEESNIINSDYSNQKEAIQENNDLEMDEDELFSIITDVGQEYKEKEIERIERANVLSEVDNTRLTPNGKIEDYIVPYKEIEDIAIKNSTEIYDETDKLNETVKNIVSMEGPIHIDSLIRRIRESCGLSRAGSKFKSTILKSIEFNEKNNSIINEEDFLFIDYEQIVVRKRDKPNIDLISDLEIEKAIDLVLSFKKSLKIKELSKQVSRTLGFKSTSKKTSNKITSVVDSMIGKGVLINNNNKIEFK